VADRRLDSGRPELRQVRRLGPVGAGHLGAELRGDEREPAHARPADPDEV